MSALGAEAVVRAQRIARQADVVAALTLEALHGSSRPFHPAIHGVRVRLILFFIYCLLIFFRKINVVICSLTCLLHGRFATCVAISLPLHV